MKTKASPRIHSFIELLEPRIAPASLTFTDVDGDTIHVTVSGAASMDDLDHAVHRVASGSGFKITSIDLAGHSVFQGVDLTITADATGGDGLVNVGKIDAKKLDLHDVTVDGNLAQIVAGDATTSTPALNHLTVESFGVPQGGSGDAPVSSINGGVGTLEVHGDVNRAWIQVSAPKAHKADGSIGTIMVTGALVGGNSKHSGSITATGEIASATVGGDLLGGKGFQSGVIGTRGKIDTITVGNITGGSGKDSGAILTQGGIDNATFNGSLTGGTGFESGSVGSLLQIQNLTVHGSVLGGKGKRSGGIVSKTSLGTVVIDSDLTGGTGLVSGTVGSDGDIASVQIGGSLKGGSNEFTGAILSGRDIAQIIITGSITNDSFVNADFTSIISARGHLGALAVASIFGEPENRALIAADGDQKVASANGVPAIGAISVSGGVSFAGILGGFAFLPGHDYKNPDASIGTVVVNGGWDASTLAAGAINRSLLFHGVPDSTSRRGAPIHPAGSPTVFSSIQNVFIKGQIFSDQKAAILSGFFAENIVAATCNGTPFQPLNPGAHNDNFGILVGTNLLVGILSEGATAG